MASVTAVIPTWNRLELLRTALEGLRRQTLAVDALVVDNGSTDGSAQAAAGAGARVIGFERNQGFAAAVNRGIREARTPWIAILNNDVSLDPDWAAQLVAACQRTGAWFATGKTLRAGAPHSIDGTFDTLARSGCAWRAGEGRPDSEEWSAERPLRFAPLTAAMFRAEVFERVGLLDEEFGSYLEDVDLGLRCALEGLAGVYVPSAVARHHSSATLGRWSGEMVRRISRNQVLLVARHFPLARFLWPVLVGQGLWGLLALRHGAGMAWLRGKREGVAWMLRHRGAAAPDAARVAALVAESEAELRALQRQSGYDRYWRLYFALT